MSRWMWVAAACALALSGCEKDQGKAPAAAAQAVPVKVFVVKATDTPVELDFVARTESSRQIAINARVNGFLQDKFFEEGMLVNDGDLLYKIDPKPFEAQVRQSKAAYDSSVASHSKAAATLNRLRPLAKSNAVSKLELDNAVGDEAASAASVAQAKAALDSAELNLSYTDVKAPARGLVGVNLQAEGTYIGTGNSQLTTLYVLDPIWVGFSMPEIQALDMFSEIKSGALRVEHPEAMPVRIELADGTVFGRKGVIDFVSPAFDANTGTFQIRASLENDMVEGQAMLRPNQFVRAYIEGAVRPNAILVPQEAVQQGAKGSFVWVVAGGKAEYRPVRLGSWNKGSWFIAEGLKDGETVVTGGVLRLVPGAPVMVLPEAAAAAQPSK